MLPLSPSEIAFECPRCRGPLVALEADGGRETDCPHCRQSLVVRLEDAIRIDKETYQEPAGLRRILHAVTDREWELMRRNLRDSRERETALLNELALLHREVDSERRLSESLREQLNRRKARIIEAPVAVAIG